VNFLLIIEIFMSWEVLSIQKEKIFSLVSVATRHHCDGLLMFIFEEISSNFGSRWQLTLVILGSCTGYSWGFMKI
jgi:hypothetical protein